MTTAAKTTIPAQNVKPGDTIKIRGRWRTVARCEVSGSIEATYRGEPLTVGLGDDRGRFAFHAWGARVEVRNA